MATRSSVAEFQLAIRRCKKRCLGVLVGLGAALALAGCGAPEQTPRAGPPGTAVAVGPMQEPSTPPAPTEVAATASLGSAGAASVSPLPAAALPPTVAPPALELVGTSIDASAAFAVLKGADERAVTVRQGDQVDGYTIADIESDRVKVRSPGNGELFLILLNAAAASLAAQANGGSHVSAAGTDLITEGVNTDQSIPEHPVFGPTGRLPKGRKQIGH